MTANIHNPGATYQDQIAVAAKYGFALANRETGELSYIAKPWDVHDQADPEKPHRYVCPSDSLSSVPRTYGVRRTYFSPKGPTGCTGAVSMQRKQDAQKVRCD